MKTFDVQQGSTEWSQLRLGVVTASEADALVSPLWKIRTGQGVETFLYKKVCEKLLGWSPDTGSTYAMDQGQLLERIALPWYAFTYDVQPKRVGFCLSEDRRIGCSPDALLGEDGGAEIKSPQPPQHLEYLLKGELPPEYRAQVHFSMLVTGRKWWEFVSFSRQLPPLVVRVHRDEKIIATIQDALDGFFERFDEAYEKVDAVRRAENAANEAAYNADPRNHGR